MAPEPTFNALFFAYFGQLVMLLRRQPGETEAMKNALRSAMAVLRRVPVRLEAGIEHSPVPDEDSLKGRLLLRQVDEVTFLPEARPADVLALARSLASNSGPIPATEHIRVVLVGVAPEHQESRRSDAFSLPGIETPVPPVEAAGTRRERTMAGPAGEAEVLTHAIRDAARQGKWMEAIHSAQALVRLTPRFPEHEQRAHQFAVRRVLERPLLEQFVAHALRTSEEKQRVREILEAGGPAAIELMVDEVRSAEAVGPRAFLHDALAGTPAALPLLLPLLSSSRWFEVRHGVELLGRLGMPEAIQPLRQVLDHPDERVRVAAVEALARFNVHGVIEPIRRVLSDQSPAARASAAFALAGRKAPGLALPIVVALDQEKDPGAWEALTEALARIDSPEAYNALVGIALEKRSLFRAGRTTAQKLAVVRALTRAGTPGSREALEKLASEGTGPVRSAAQGALN